MRLLTQTLSLYIFLLAFIPCQDNFSLIPNEAPASVHADHPEHDPQDSEHEDHCTPFCICACCGAVLDAPPTLLTLEEAQPLPPKGNTQPQAIKHWNPGIFADSSWQPPRFA